jgi:hypothetical protein
MVIYYVTLFVSLLLNYMPHHIFCLGGMHVTTYVTPTMSSLRVKRTLYMHLSVINYVVAGVAGVHVLAN